MQIIPQIMPISNLRTNHNAVLNKLGEGPVILSQRGKPRAVMISADEWNETAIDSNEMVSHLPTV